MTNTLSLKSEYEFRSGETGIFVEIYLPKKPEFQETLFDTLTGGFNLESVKGHFRNRENEIKSFLQDHYISNFTREKIEGMSRVFKGYSIYDVDGVFYNEETGNIDGEVTQVIRIMFVVEWANVPSKLPYTSKKRVVKDYLRFTGRRDTFLEEYSEKDELLERDDLGQIVTYIRHWEAQVALFVFGYVLFLICERVKELNQKKGRRWEEEIWVSSFWNFVLNRVAKVKE